MKSTRDVAARLPHEVGQEHERTVQHGDEVNIVGQIAPDCGSQLGHALLDLVRRE